jgi:hypothetical protein
MVIDFVTVTIKQEVTQPVAEKKLLTYPIAYLY